MTKRLGKLHFRHEKINVEKRPPVNLASNAVYDGEWDKTTNLRSGVGRIIFSDGSLYEG